MIGRVNLDMLGLVGADPPPAGVSLVVASGMIYCPPSEEHRMAEYIEAVLQRMYGEGHERVGEYLD